MTTTSIKEKGFAEDVYWLGAFRDAFHDVIKHVVKSSGLELAYVEIGLNWIDLIVGVHVVDPEKAARSMKALTLIIHGKLPSDVDHMEVNIIDVDKRVDLVDPGKPIPPYY